MFDMWRGARERLKLVVQQQEGRTSVVYPNLFPFSVASGTTAREFVIKKGKYYVSNVQMSSRF
jgi:hypothetical protein